MDNYDVMAGGCENCEAADREIDKLTDRLDAADRETLAAFDMDRARRTAADALFAASQDAAKFVAKHVADTGSTLGQRALDRLEKAMRECEEAK